MAIQEERGYLSKEERKRLKAMRSREKAEEAAEESRDSYSTEKLNLSKKPTRSGMGLNVIGHKKKGKAGKERAGPSTK